MTIQDISLPDISVHPLASHCYSGESAYTARQDQGQEQGQASSTVDAKTETEDAVAGIGAVLSNGRFMCDAEGCGGQTFARHAELRRHYTTIHASNKPNFWCHVRRCRRSISGGGKAFHRKDKLMAHIKSRHSGVQ
jgi:hypothetical protein